MTESRIPETVTSFIDGSWVEARDAAHEIPFVHPADERPVSTLFEANADEVGRAVTAAADTFRDGCWSSAAVDERKRVLLKISELIHASRDELAHCEVMHTGVPISQASAPRQWYCRMPTCRPSVASTTMVCNCSTRSRATCIGS